MAPVALDKPHMARLGLLIEAPLRRSSFRLVNCTTKKPEEIDELALPSVRLGVLDRSNSNPSMVVHQSSFALHFSQLPFQHRYAGFG
jgi:hypothetical protein